MEKISEVLPTLPYSRHQHYQHDKMQIAYLINEPDYQEHDMERFRKTYLETTRRVSEDTALKPLYGSDHRDQSSCGHASAPPDVTSLDGVKKGRVYATTSAAADVTCSSLQDRTVRKTIWNNDRLSPSITSQSPSKPTRPARPSYNPEQKFFIMYCRITKKLPWIEIKREYRKVFGVRTKDGLTSVYYRIRHEWGMVKVEKASPDGCCREEEKVEEMSKRFTLAALQKLGYVTSRQE